MLGSVKVKIKNVVLCVMEMYRWICGLWWFSGNGCHCPQNRRCNCIFLWRFTSYLKKYTLLLLRQWQFHLKKLFHIPFKTIAFYGALVIEIVVRVQKMCLSDFKTYFDKFVLIPFLKVYICLKQFLIFYQDNIVRRNF